MASSDPQAYDFYDDCKCRAPLPLQITFLLCRVLVDSAPSLESFDLQGIFLARALLHLIISLAKAIEKKEVEAAAEVILVPRLRRLVDRLETVFDEINQIDELKTFDEINEKKTNLKVSLKHFFHELSEEQPEKQPGVDPVRQSFKSFEAMGALDDWNALQESTPSGADDQTHVWLHVQKHDSLKVVFEALELEMNTNPMQQITIVNEKEQAQLDIGFENDRIVLNILDPLVTMHGLTRMPFTIIPLVGDVRPVIRAAAHYYWHLRRSGGNPKGLHSRVQVEFKRLQQVEEEYDDDLRPIRTPCGNDLICQGVIDLVVDKEAVYGIKITNKSQIPLYTSVFFFDNSNLSITSYFQPGSAREMVDPPIPPEESLTIGYGAGGARPFKYVLGANQDIDVGFVKLFLSTTKVDLSNVPQASPFSTARTQKFVEDKRHEQWDTILFTVVQRRNPPT